jgi:hypothetical protein
MVKFVGDYKRLINLDHVRKLEISSRYGGMRLDVTWADGRREKFKRLSEAFVESIERFVDEQAAQRMDTMQGEDEAHFEEAEARATETVEQADTGNLTSDTDATRAGGQEGASAEATAAKRTDDR